MGVINEWTDNHLFKNFTVGKEEEKKYFCMLANCVEIMNHLHAEGHDIYDESSNYLRISYLHYFTKFAKLV